MCDVLSLYIDLCVGILIDVLNFVLTYIHTYKHRQTHSLPLCPAPFFLLPSIPSLLTHTTQLTHSYPSLTSPQPSPSLLPFTTRTPGKWHLGGMREENRLQRTNDDNCHFPSPNQHGFEEYISGHFHGNLFIISSVFVFLCLCVFVLFCFCFFCFRLILS
jgi:hypothetical protein